ncbi:hypothetical protein J1N51_09000 [Psychrosphaera ytuae]|uniref:Uncharacterized protein n=1 Tax=Psychrosphaera ytuae TaxID=2820710 RepID=A0A975D9Q4_9GAMM|nr:hypothetical protein [Psychrosphaera ytuae]QTH62899.1 hypothetical protein J1N51_09000 [Psychrosphaera ytuae]
MKFLIFLLVVISLLTVDHPQVNKIRTDLATLIGQLVESEYSRGQTSKKVYDELAGQFDTFKPREEEYVKAITASPVELYEFYQEFCKHKVFNEKISAYNMRVVCRTIEAHYVDLENEVIRQTRN